MVFNFMLPDEVIQNIWGPCLETPEEREKIELIFYTLFLEKLNATFQSRPKLIEFLNMPEIQDKYLSGGKAAGEIMQLSAERLLRGDDEKVKDNDQE